MYDLDYTWNQNTTSGFNSYLFPPINQWSFVAMVISPAQTVLYLINSDGFQAATNAVANDAEEFGVAWHLGDDGVFGGGVRTFPGIIDEVAVFTSALNQNQLLNLYFNGVGAPPQAAVPTASPSTNLFVGDSVLLSETPLGATPFEYQWESNGLVLAEATNSSLILTNLSLAASGIYQVIVSNNYGAATSAPLTLAVTLDTNPPVALRGFNIGPTNVELDFSKTVEAASATNLANYSFTNGLAITAASLATNYSSVLLTTAPMIDGDTYGIVINGVRDQAIPPNTIASNTLVTFTASPFAPADIGGSSVVSTDIYTTGGVIVSSAGNNIGGASDQFNFDYELQTGNFDVAVCLAGLGLSDLWAQAGLMARVNLAAGSPFAAALATPGINGDFFADRATTNGTATTSGNFPVNYPNTWLRLNRVGNVFTGFGSYDGTNWTQLGTVTMAMPAQIYLGFAVASDSANQLTTAQFVNYENTPTNAAGGHAGQSPRRHRAERPDDADCVLGNHVEARAAHGREKSGVSGTLQFQSVVSGHQRLSNHLCGHELHVPARNTRFPAAVIWSSPRRRRTSKASMALPMSWGHTPAASNIPKRSNCWTNRPMCLLTVPYTDVYPWPVATDGTGHSLDPGQSNLWRRRPAGLGHQRHGGRIARARWIRSRPARCATWSSTKFCRTRKIRPCRSSLNFTITARTAWMFRVVF